MSDNQLLIEVELMRLASIDASKLLGKHYRVCKLADSEYRFTVTMLRKDRVLFKTYHLSETRQHSINHYRLYQKDVHQIIKHIIEGLTPDDIELAEDIRLDQCNAPPTSKKSESAELTRKRKSKNSETSYNQQEKDLNDAKPYPANSKERAHAKLERKMFNNPNLWKFRL